MDIRKHDSITNADKGVELVLEEGPDGGAITMYGTDSAAYKELDREIARRNAERRGPVSPKVAEDQMMERLVALTKGWRGLTEDGKELKYSPQEAERFYRAYPHYADLATAFAFDRRNFFPTASST